MEICFIMLIAPTEGRGVLQALLGRLRREAGAGDSCVSPLSLSSGGNLAFLPTFLPSPPLSPLPAQGMQRASGGERGSGPPPPCTCSGQGQGSQVVLGLSCDSLQIAPGCLHGSSSLQPCQLGVGWSGAEWCSVQAAAAAVGVLGKVLHLGLGLWASSMEPMCGWAGSCILDWGQSP